ncbi:Replicative DNA helicase [compost metagenome]
MYLYSIHAEQSVLGEILSNPHLLDDAAALLTEHDFFQSSHKVIFSKINYLKSKQMGFDPITLAAQNPAVIQVEYLSSLIEKRSYDNFMDHIDVIKSFALKRKIIDDSNSIIEKIKNEEDVTSDELISISQKNSNEMLDYAVGKNDSAKSYADIMPDFIEELKQRAECETGVTGLATGYDELDDITSGLQNSDLIIIAARPSMGKTTFAMNLVENICLNNHRGLVFSMEMPKKDLLNRTFASVGGINQTNLKKGNLTQLELANFMRAKPIIEKMRVSIDDEAGLTLAKLRARAIKAHRESPLSVIMIDYLQLMNGDGKDKDSNRTNIISEISRGLKALAKELEIPVIVLSQLNRSLEQRQDKRPINSDLRESGAIEQDADIIMFVYRDEVYNPDSLDKGLGEIIIGKHRNGSLGTVKLLFEGDKSRFSNQASSGEKIVEYRPKSDFSYVETNAGASDVNLPDSQSAGSPPWEDDLLPLDKAETIF